MKRRSVTTTRIIAAGMLAVFLGAASASAIRPEGLTLDQLTRRASVIVEGWGTAVNSAWNAAAPRGIRFAISETGPWSETVTAAIGG